MTTFRLGVISEIHLAQSGAPGTSWHNPLRFDIADDLLGRAVAWCVDSNVDAIAVLGDLTNSADTESFERVVEVVTAPGLPVHVVPGNHDLTPSPPGDDAFQQQVRDAKVTGGSASSAVRPGLPLQLVGLTRPGDRGGYLSHYSGEGRTRDEVAIVLTHFPVLPLSDRFAGAGLKHAGDLLDRNDLQRRLMEGQGPTVVLHGHLHVHDAQISGTLLHLSSAALIEPPHHVAVATFQAGPDGEVEIVREAVSVESTPGVDLPVLAPCDQSWRYADGIWSEIP